MYTHNIFIHSFVDGHLDCFHVFAVVKSASINIGVNVCFQIIGLSVGQGVGLLDHTATLLFVI